MDRKSVQSSMLVSVGFEESTETLELEFQSGKVFQYYGVPTSTYQHLMLADSKGSYCRDLIIDQYPYMPMRR